jgi:hypothetical protein
MDSSGGDLLCYDIPVTKIIQDNTIQDIEDQEVRL